MVKFKFQKGVTIKPIDNQAPALNVINHKMDTLEYKLIEVGCTDSFKLSRSYIDQNYKLLIEEIQESSSVKEKEASTVGLRFNQGKLPLDQVPPSLEKAFALVAAHGEKKYSKHNWRKGMSWSSVYGCARRHMRDWFQGQELDDVEGGSKLPHLYHALWNIAALIEYQEKQIGLDDRWHKSQPKDGSKK